MIVSVVDKKRPGLCEHSSALCTYLQESGFEAISMVPKPFCYSKADLKYSFSHLLKSEVKVIVLWSFGISGLFTIVFKLLGKKVIWIQHEPGGLSQRLSKKDPIFYSLLSSFFEIFFSTADKIVTPSNKWEHLFIDYAPLLFVPKKIKKKNNRHFVTYLGRRDMRRGLKIFEELKTILPEKNKTQFFPDKNINSSKDKTTVLSKTVAVINLYEVPHNQSGVTIDALRHGVPVIVSELDFWAEEIKIENAGVVLRTDNMNSITVLDAIKKIEENFDDFSKNASKLSDKLCGSHAFKTFWLPLFKEEVQQMSQKVNVDRN